MSLPRYAKFKDAEDNVVALGFCNAGWSVSVKDIPDCIKEAHNNAMRAFSVLTLPQLKFQEVNLDVDDKMYRTMLNDCKKMMDEYKEDNPKLFEKGWNSDWAKVEVYDYVAWRVDMEAVHAEKLSQEDFFDALKHQEYNDDSPYKERSILEERRSQR